MPVGEPTEDEVLERGYLSVSDDDSEGQGLELAFEGNAFAEYEDAEEGTMLPVTGYVEADFDFDP